MSNTTLGIDVSKSELSVALLKENKVTKAKFSNDISGFEEMHQWLHKNKIEDIKVSMEATGHYCFGIADFLYHKGYETYVINPFCIKSFGNTRLSCNKKDEADAVVIAEYIARNEAKRYSPAPKIIREIRELDKCLDAMKSMRAKTKTRIADRDYLPKQVIDFCKTTIAHLDQQIKEIEKAILTLIRSNKELKQHYDNLQTIPGISSTTAITLLALIPDISRFIDARQLAAFAELTPRQRTSGASLRGKSRLSKIGSCRLRKALFCYGC